MSWKLIESAPKDGTAVLACGLYDGREDLGVHPRTVHFKDYHPNRPGKGAWRNHLGHKEVWLTHWMPLPNPPKSNKTY